MGSCGLARSSPVRASRMPSPGLWQHPEMLDALKKRNIRQVFRLVRLYAGVSQTRIGIAVNLSQGKVSEIMCGSAQVAALDVFERIADGLRMPDPARLALGLAPRAASGPSQQDSKRAPSASTGSNTSCPPEPSTRR